MADINTITNLINSPPGQLVAGATLAGIVWKFFDKVEEKLNDDTKLEIAVWLLGVKTADKVQSWSETFATLVVQVFGRKPLTFLSLWRSSLASSGAYLLCLGLSYPKAFLDFDDLTTDLFMLAWTGILPDYISLVKTRWLIRVIQRNRSATTAVTIFLGDFALGAIIAYVGGAVLWLAGFFATGHRFPPPPTSLPSGSIYFVGFSLPLFPNLAASLFTSIWLWLYASSGLLLKATRRFDIGFQWFNRRFDIEKHPLSSIGLVAGCIVALVYWGCAAGSRWP